jgi:hypothetical protein
LGLLIPVAYDSSIVNVRITRPRERLPLLRIRYYRPDLWLPELGRRCELCGEWFTTIGEADHIPDLEIHEMCEKATVEELEQARKLVKG